MTGDKARPRQAPAGTFPEGFFGRRKGKPLRSHQQDLIEKLLPRLRLDLSAPPDLDAAFGGLSGPVRLEIGFGGGEYLIEQARREPGARFIGIEPFLNGMAKALAKIEQTDVANIRLSDGAAAQLLDWLPAASLARVDLLYPDPWPKRRHHKRRFVNEDNLARIARALAKGGEFRFASDIADYVNWTLAHGLGRGEFEWTARRACDWREPWEGWLATRYEAKAKAQGRRPAYLVFARR